MSLAWPATPEMHRSSPCVGHLVEEVVFGVMDQFDLSGTQYEGFFYLCGESRDGRSLFAVHISSFGYEICVLEDCNGEGWVVFGSAGAEQHALRKISSNDDPRKIMNACAHMLSGQI